MQQILNNKKQILIALLVIGLFIGLILIITNNSDDANKTTTGNNASSQTVDTPPITNSNGDTTEDTNETTPEDTNPTPDDDSSTSSTSTTTRLVSTTSVVVQPTTTTTTDPQTTPEASSNNQQSSSSNNYVGNTLQSDDDNDQQTPSSVQQQSQSSSDNVKVPLPYTIKSEKYVNYNVINQQDLDANILYHYTVDIDPEYIDQSHENGIVVLGAVIRVTYIDTPCNQDIFSFFGKADRLEEPFVDVTSVNEDYHMGLKPYQVKSNQNLEASLEHQRITIQPRRLEKDIKVCVMLEENIVDENKVYDCVNPPNTYYPCNPQTLISWKLNRPIYVNHYYEFTIRKSDLLIPGIQVIQEETSAEAIVDGDVELVKAIEVRAYHYNVPNFDYNILSRDVAYSGISNCPVNNNQIVSSFDDSDWILVYVKDGKEYNYDIDGGTFVRAVRANNPGTPLDNSAFAAPVIFLKSELEGITNCTVDFTYNVLDEDGNIVDTLRTTYTVVVD